MFKRKTKNDFKQVVKSPAFIMMAVSLAILTLQIAFIGKLRPFNSDDLYWQQVVHTWTPFSGDTFYFGTKDIFVALGPFFTIMEHLFNPGRKLLIAETIMLTCGTFVLFYASSLYFLHKLRVKLTYSTLLPFVWLASFGYPLVQNYLNSDWRTFQLGFSFATFALLAAYLNKDIDPLRSARTKALTALFAILTGVLMYGDPYYTFFTIGPIVLFAASLFLIKKIDRSQALLTFGFIAASLVIAKLVAILCDLAGIYIVMSTPSIFVDFDDILTNIISSLHGMLIIFGADFFGRPAANPVTFGFAVNAALLVFILYKAIALYRTVAQSNIRRISLPQLWPVFLVGTMGFIFIVYTSSSLVTVSNYRFFIMFIYCAVALLAIIIGLSRNQTANLAIATLLVVATVFNVAYTTLTDSVRSQGDVAHNIGNALNYDLIKAIEKEGLTKGYASYWQGNVNTYLSDNRVVFLPSLCMPDGKTTQFRWLIDGGQFERRAQRSFFLIDPDIPQPPICNRDQLEDQFGEPEKTLRIYNKTILLYDYDITSKME